MNDESNAYLAYIGQLLWLIGGQLNALLRGGPYDIPDISSLTAAPGDSPGVPPGDPFALLARLKGDAPRS